MPAAAAPPPPARTNYQLNLSVLRRHNPAVDSIISIAPYAVVYVFTSVTQQWEKSGIEGTLFVCRLSAQETDVERYAVMVLNRRGLQNFTAELLNSGDVEVTEEYVILQVTEGKQESCIYGLWIFSEPPPSSTANARSINAQIIQDCATQAETSRRSAAERAKDQVHVQAQAEPVGKETAGDGPVDSMPMGRQVSLRELFGQQREQDSGWSVKHHGSQDPGGQFSLSADTEFFRSTIRPSQQHKFPKGKMQEGPLKNGN